MASLQLQPETRVRWRRCADDPVEMAHAQVVVHGEKVFVSAGNTLHKKNCSKVFEYNTREDVWSSLPCSVKGFALAHFRGRLITVGGVDTSARVDTSHTVGPGGADTIVDCNRFTRKVFTLSADGQQWEESIPPMRTARSMLSVATTATAIVAAGGKGYSYSHVLECKHVPVCTMCGIAKRECSNLCEVEVYSSDASRWLATDSLRWPLCGMSSAVVDTTLYLMGGVGEGGCTKCCISASLPSLVRKAVSRAPRWAVSSESLWKTHSPTPCCGSAAVCLSGTLVAVGGTKAKIHYQQRRHADDYFDSIYGLFDNLGWVKLPHGHLPDKRWCCATAQLSPNEVIVIGGYNELGYAAAVYVGKVAPVSC